MDKKRSIISLVLLTVFLSAYMTSSVHKHPQQESEAVVCAKCVHHLPHAGHLSSFDGGLSDCVLCHFLGLPFVITLALVILPAASLIRTLYTVLRRPFVSALMRYSLSRAPPVLSFA